MQSDLELQLENTYLTLSQFHQIPNDLGATAHAEIYGERILIRRFRQQMVPHQR